MAAPSKTQDCLAQSEYCLLTCFESEKADLPDLVTLFLKGNYEEILESSESAKLMFSDRASNPDSHDQLCKILEVNIKQYLAKEDVSENRLRDLNILIVALSCLQLFVQNNFLGPPTTKSPLQFLHEDHKLNLTELETEALTELGVDGESPYSKSRYLIYLHIARVILLNCRSHFTHVKTWDWWLMRCLVIQQTVLSEKSPTLKEIVMDIIDNLSSNEHLMTDECFRDLQILFHTEAGHACQTFLEFKKSAEHFNQGKKIAGLQIELTGAMGKRTRFQQDNKAQLKLHVHSQAHDVRETLKHKAALPKILPLDDDTVLEEVKFADADLSISTEPSPFEQTLILGLMESYRRSMAEDRLTKEEVLTYIDYILGHVTNWSVAVVALRTRCKLERDSRRRVERSMMQLEELTKVASSMKSSPEISRRMPLFYAARVPALWDVQRDLADMFLSLGLVGNALDVFERLQMWDDVISCYQRLGKLEKAETVIREQLAIQETPALLCFLGDVTCDIGHYKKAWELSGHRNSRAMRCMGYKYFHQENYEKALECFATSLEINSLQVPVWFTYGCAAMACQKFEIGTKAFRRCVNIDYDNYEAWSNLATCFVRLKEKHKAYATLQDAIRCNYENWRLWENNLIVGIDCGEFEDVIRSYHHLMDLKDKWVDNEVLNILTKAVIEDIPDANGNPASKLVGKLLELFGRLTSKVTSEGEIWANYAKLCSSEIGDKKPDMDKALQYLQRAYRCFTQKADWEKNLDNCKKVAEEAVRLAQAHVQCAEVKDREEGLRLLSAAKLMLKGALVKIQKQHTDPVSGTLSQDAEEICQTMEPTLTEIVTKLEELRGK